VNVFGIPTRQVVQKNKKKAIKEDKLHNPYIDIKGIN
jgi:hypothetical protein